jgi:hypothetical protein
MKEESHPYNNFIYVRDSGQETPYIKHKLKRPENIFKFYALNQYNIDALTNGYFYASHPFELNDFFDCNRYLFYTSKDLPFALYQEIFNELKKEEIKDIYLKDIKLPQKCDYILRTLWEIFTNKFGIISTTAEGNNPLMWPHYCQEKGFQLKFNTDKIEKSIKDGVTEGEYLGFFPVNYCDKLKPIDINKFRNNMYVPLCYATNLKLKDWSYEKEWRFVISKDHMGIPFSKTALYPKKDHFVKLENRFGYYDKGLVEEITLGMNFLNSGTFNIKPLGENRCEISPLKADDVNECPMRLLNYIVNNLSDKVFVSSYVYSGKDKQFPSLARTRAKLGIKKQNQNTFHIRFHQPEKLI